MHLPFPAAARTLSVAFQLAHARELLSLFCFVTDVDSPSQLYPFAVLNHLQTFAACLLVCCMFASPFGVSALAISLKAVTISLSDATTSLGEAQLLTGTSGAET